ncbi:hypothetical protein [Nocardioides maradonensis]
MRFASFVIRSYATPIAWWATRPHDTMAPEDVVPFLETGEFGMWVVPAVKYSVTTTQHQGLVTGALSTTWRDPERVAIPYSSGWGEYDERVPMGGQR